MINDIAENYIVGTVEKSTNICSFEFCNFKYSEYENSQNFTYFKDVLAIYLNLYTIELFQNLVPDITTKSTNFFDEKYNTPSSFQEDEQLYLSYKSVYLTKQVSDNGLFFHYIFSHMPLSTAKMVLTIFLEQCFN